MEAKAHVSDCNDLLKIVDEPLAQSSSGIDEEDSKIENQDGNILNIFKPFDSPLPISFTVQSKSTTHSVNNCLKILDIEETKVIEKEKSLFRQYSFKNRENSRFFGFKNEDDDKKDNLKRRSYFTKKEQKEEKEEIDSNYDSFSECEDNEEKDYKQIKIEPIQEVKKADIININYSTDNFKIIQNQKCCLHSNNLENNYNYYHGINPHNNYNQPDKNLENNYEKNSFSKENYEKVMNHIQNSYNSNFNYSSKQPQQQQQNFYMCGNKVNNANNLNSLNNVNNTSNSNYTITSIMPTTIHIFILLVKAMMSIIKIIVE